MSDASNRSDVIPFRLYSYDINSPQYHRGVYNCLKGSHKNYIKFDGPIDTLMLFECRRKNKWKGADSLYDAWLIGSFNEYRDQFNHELFEE